MNKEQLKLERSIRKLELAYEYGVQLLSHLDAGGRTQYRKTGYVKATQIVCKQLKVTFSASSARNYATFARRFTKADLNRLISDCKRYQHAPGFDVVVRLIAVRSKRLREKLIREVLANRWPKTRLGQEMRKLAATESLARRDGSRIGDKNRGRMSRAVTTGVEGLLGELQDDALKWRRVQQFLAANVESGNTESLGCSLNPALLEEIKELADKLDGFFDWEV